MTYFLGDAFSDLFLFNIHLLVDLVLCYLTQIHTCVQRFVAENMAATAVKHACLSVSLIDAFNNRVYMQAFILKYGTIQRRTSVFLSPLKVNV